MIFCSSTLAFFEIEIKKLLNLISTHLDSIFGKIVDLSDDLAHTRLSEQVFLRQSDVLQ